MRSIHSPLLRYAASALTCVAASVGHAPAQTLTPIQAPIHAASAERWNAYGQATFIGQSKPGFGAAYTNLNGTPNSLLSTPEKTWSWTVTGYFGWQPWRGAGLYFAPEAIAELPLSGLHGLGGSIQNAELQKTGGTSPTYYRSRLYLRQVWNLGGASQPVESGPLQLAGSVQSRRLALTVGNLSILDLFDRNQYTGDLRQQFMNMAFLTYAAYDFAADARGYSWGATAEYYHDDWAVRFGRFLTPKDPNQLALDTRIFRFYGDQLEVEHAHTWAGQPGKLRLLVYRNHENMGGFSDAVAALQNDPASNATRCTAFNYGSLNAAAPDLCYVRRPRNKVGIGISLEQALGPAAGVFLRAMASDGRTEVYSYTSSDRSLSLGALVRGDAWGRPRDSAGVAYGASWLSGAHVAYLALGGIDGFIGDGALNYRPEQIGEVFYSVGLARKLWATIDLQAIRNPGYNADRGPVKVFGVRLHLEI